MSELMDRLATLSPEKRRLLELRIARTRAEAAGNTIQPRPRPHGTAPLSYAQARLWLLERMETGAAAYNTAFHVRMRGALNVAALERAVNGLRERHESLRTTFAERDGEAVQVIHPFAPEPLPVTDLSALPADERERRATLLSREASNQPYDLEQGPLMRQSLVRLADHDHMLLLSMHHIVSDGWSGGVIGRELAALYEAFAAGRPNPLPPPAIQYADFAAWQREHLRGDSLRGQIDFWRTTLDGAPPALELPTDRVRPRAPSHRGDSLTLNVPADVGNRLRELGRAEGATIFPVLLAAYRIVLSRHAGQDDVVIGTPVANRTRREIEPLVGFFVNTLALRTDLSGDPTFRELLRRERDAVLAAFSHQDLPFEQVVEALKLPRDPSRNPVFQAMLTLQNAGSGNLEMGGLEMEVPGVEYPIAKFDLTFDSYEENGGGLCFLVDWATDLFARPGMERLAEHFVRVLESAATNPDTPVSRLAMMGDDERRLATTEWNRTAIEIPSEPVHRLFEAQAAATPDAPAVEWGGETVSYVELNARANRLARHLVARGAGPESRIGVSMERGAELVGALLGILKTGGAYVPLDPAYPAERLAYMTADAGVSILVVRDAVPDALSTFSGAVVSLRADAERIAAAEATDFSDDVFSGPDSLAYVVYTSGSTGQPKGSAIPHRAIVRLVRGADYVQLAPGDRVAQMSNASFDAVTWEVWGALLNGAALVGFDRETVLSPSVLTAALRDRRITAAFLTTALFNQVARTIPAGFGTLTHLCFGGEACDPAAIRAVLTAGGPKRLLHVYGPTETTTFATWRLVDDVAEDAATLPIGLPIRNTTAYVLDGRMELAPLGVPGELFIGGRGVARGYLGRPGLTAERFVPDAFSDTPGARLYRTGDRVRRRENGDIEFLGRLDSQVKIRGYRIEPAEVEAALRDLPAVEDSAVVVLGLGADRRLVGYVVAAPGHDPSGAELREALRGRMPAYMVPGAIVRLASFPLNANGKIDRRALPAPDAVDAEEKVAPGTATERALADIWGEVLGAPVAGVDDDFFVLGGHSLLATRVVSRVRQALRVELPLRAVFEASTLRRLAERVDALRGQAADDGPALVAVSRTGELPLSFAQERMWFLEQMAPEAAAYNMPLVMDLSGAVHADALRGAIDGVIARHEALRTSFPARDGRPVLRIHPHAPFHLPVLNVADEEELDHLLAADARAPFDLENGPPIRATLFRADDGEQTLLINMHHAVSDGWSLDVFFREMAELYAAAVEGRAPSLPDLAIQYADFAAWQRRWLRGDTLERQVSFWRERLKSAPAVLEMPTDRPRPAQPSYRGGRVDLRIPAGLNDALQAIARAEGATLFMVTLAAFQALLGRYSRQDDVVIGTPIAGRNRAETEPLVGFFVNTLALRGDLSGDPSFRALLGRVREATLQAYAHQDLPFERLVDELKIERSTAYPPLFQVMFALQNAPGGALRVPGAEVTYRELPHHSAKFDLTMNLFEEDGQLWASLEYATDLWDGATAERLAAHYLRLLHGIAAAPDRALSEHDIAGDEERATVAAWSRGAEYAVEDRDVPVHVLFSRQAAATPHAAALAWDGGEMRFGELNERANRLANHLRTRGVRAGSRVGVCLERGPGMVVAVVAALKAGATYVPLDPLYPADRLAYMVRDAHMEAVIANSGTRTSVETAGAMLVDVDAERGAIDAQPDAEPGIDLGPEALAYVIYTSGSTGRPKGVAVPHRGIVRLVRGADYADLGPGQTFLQIVPVSFDVATWEIWAPLLNGGRLVLYPPRIPEPAEIRDVVRRHGVTTLWLTSGLFHVVADEAPDAFGGLQQFFSGGDVLSVAHVRRLREAYPRLRIVDGYGPTENTTYTTCHTVRDTDLSRATIPIGRPVAGTTTYVLDGHLRPCPAGVAGELFTGGDGVAVGYLDRPAMTAEKFIPDPFSTTPGARMYRIGDLCRWLADGTLEFLGRIDTQVKVRGFRIEPGEIEAALLAHPAVEEAVVVARADSRGDKRLVAYVVPRNGRMPEAATLRDAVRDRLPDYMVPAAFVPMAALPLNPNGKVDRNALPAPDLAEDRAFAPPVTETERALAELWAALLGVDRVGLDDGFFDLGGHSLLATQLVSRIRSALGAEVGLRTVFESGTLRTLAERVEAARARVLSAGPALVPVDRSAGAPLSFAQERMWFISRMLPTPAYNMPFRLRLRGGVNADALRAALGDLVARHEALRTTFHVAAGQPMQVVTPPAPFHLPVIDVRDRPVSDAESEAERIAADDAVTPFDLVAGPLFRAALVRMANDRSLLLLTMHHIVSDGWSMDVIYRELAALYAARLAGESADLPPLAIQYPDFAAWQREWLSGDRLAAQLAYWRGALAGAPSLDLPTDRPRPASASLRGGWVDFRVPDDAAAAVQSIARAEGATLFQTLLAAFTVLLSEYAGQTDLVVGTPIAGRTRGEAEGLVGLFVNTLALRASTAGDPTFRELVGRVREATLDAYAHQEVPFEKLVDELKVERSLSRHPLFQVTFTVEEGALSAPATLRLGDAEAATESGDTRTSKFDLTCGFTATPEGMFGGMEYAADLWDEATMRRMADHLLALVGVLAAQPDLPLSRLPGLLQCADRETVLQSWSGDEHPFPDARAHELFVEQARRTPENVALVYRDQSVSYRELDEASSRLAHHLAARGVRPETTVGVFAERLPETVVAILAILKAGGAYVPLDPAYPADRLRYMLAEAGLRTVIAPAGVPAGLPADLIPDVLDPRAEADTIATRPAEAPNVSIAPDHLAYVIFTSGSTGLPKGVMVTHRGVPNLALSQIGQFRIDESSRVLQFASFSFDAAVSELFTALLSGAALVLAGRDELVPGAPLAGTLRRERISVVTLPPSVLAVLSPDELPDLRTLVSAGEAVGPAVVQRWAPGRRFINAYGPTETTVGPCSAVCTPDERTPPIGRPFHNVRVYVVNGSGEPVPIGVPGELCVGGPGVARGYLHRAALTAESFIPDAFGAPGGRLYRTGDRVRWRADGMLQFLGRVDQQVKVRGFRVEPGEIAAQIGGFPGVRDALVVVRADGEGDARLVAYLVPVQAGRAPRTGELREHLKRVLPDYMVPAAFVTLDAFPRTPNGKVDHAALPAPPAPADAGQGAPRGELERRIAAVWARVLGLRSVGVRDNFFDIGGHSLLLARLQEELETALERPVSLIDLFQYSTVTALAARLEARDRAAAPVDPVEDGDGPVDGAPRQAPVGRGAARRHLLQRGRR